MGRHGTIIHRGVTDDDGQGQGGGAGDLPARDALGLRLRADPRRVGDPLRDRQEESVERSEEHTSELQSLAYLVCRLLLEKKKIKYSLHFCRIVMVIKQ